jgi:hypothetical protein
MKTEIECLNKINIDSKKHDKYGSSKFENVSLVSKNKKSQRKLSRPPTVSIRKRIVKLVFSNAGLLVFFSVYICVGALLFKLLEQHEELRLCEEGKGKFTKELQNLHERLVHYIIYNATDNSLDLINNIDSHSLYPKNASNYVSYIGFKNESSSDDTARVISRMLLQFRDFSLYIKSDYNYVGRECEENSKWKYLRALEFCMTLITTIG